MAVTEKDDRLSFCLEAFSRLVRTRQLSFLGKGKSVCIVALKQCLAWDTQGITGDHPSHLGCVFISPRVGQSWHLFPKLL